MPKPTDISNVSAHKDGKGEMLMECTQVGTIMRVAVVDVATGTEVVFQAPMNASRPTLERIAKDKLNYVMKKQKR